jgi:hypothetical protein
MSMGVILCDGPMFIPKSPGIVRRDYPLLIPDTRPEADGWPEALQARFQSPGLRRAWRRICMSRIGDGYFYAFYNLSQESDNAQTLHERLQEQQ